jgi:hypothetical protein
MTGHKPHRSAKTRALGLVLLACLLAGFWSCSAQPRAGTVPESAPRPGEEVPAEPAEPAPEVKPEAKVQAEAEPAAQAVPEGLELLKTMSVPSISTWTDTGLDVQPGEEFVIKGTGGISLQRGNPTAFCGPDGYDLRTAQQPLPDKNIGALVGRVVQLVSIETDPETKKQVRNELIEVFYIGSESRTLMPIRGRLYLGVNENVAGDNAGEFKASIYRLKKFQD